MQLNQIAIYLDKSPAASLPSHIQEELSLRGLIAEDGFQRISFCGMLMVEGKMNVFLPRSSEYASSLKDKVSIASLTIKAVEKYGKDRATRVDLNDEQDGSKGLGKLSLIKKLLDDFRQYGIYSRRTVIRKMNAAKPDWGRTISRSMPILSSDGTPIYLDIHSSQRKYLTNTVISLIHAQIIRDLDRDFSWIITGRLGLIAPELNEYPDPAVSISHQIYVLKNELHQTYSERDIRLLKDLIQYLQEFSGRDSSHFIAGVRDFHFAWEYMLRTVLENKVDLNSHLPAPAYIGKDGKVITANQKNMRTDIILEDKTKNILAVIDAKYYEATIPENSPGWPDLVKQFFYAKAIKLIRPETAIRNYFVFPRKSGVMAQVRMRDRLSGDDKFHDDQFAPVDCIYVCPIEVIQHFTAGKKMSDLSKQLLLPTS